MLHLIFVNNCLLFCGRYWKKSHFQAIEVVLQALEAAYSSEKPSLTSAAMRWMYHHSQLQVPLSTDTGLCFQL